MCKKAPIVSRIYFRCLLYSLESVLKSCFPALRICFKYMNAFNCVGYCSQHTYIYRLCSLYIYLNDGAYHILCVRASVLCFVQLNGTNCMCLTSAPRILYKEKINTHFVSSAASLSSKKEPKIIYTGIYRKIITHNNKISQYRKKAL